MKEKIKNRISLPFPDKEKNLWIPGQDCDEKGEALLDSLKLSEAPAINRLHLTYPNACCHCHHEEDEEDDEDEEDEEDEDEEDEEEDQKNNNTQ